MAINQVEEVPTFDQIKVMDRAIEDFDQRVPTCSVASRPGWFAELAINRARDIKVPGHVQKRVRYGGQRVTIGCDQANQMRCIGFGQRNPDQSLTRQ
jgi:hypothetical protein